MHIQLVQPRLDHGPALVDAVVVPGDAARLLRALPRHRLAPPPHQAVRPRPRAAPVVIRLPRVRRRPILQNTVGPHCSGARDEREGTF